MELTRKSLLVRVRDPSDEAAWREFSDQYRELLERYCRARGLQAADVDDVCQLAFVNLLRSLRAFEYDPARGRFRHFLGRIVRNAIHTHFSRPGRAHPALDTTILAAIPDEPEQDASWEQEWMDQHYRRAMRAVRESFDARSVEVFDALLSGSTVEAVAAARGMSDQAVYKIKQRIRDRLSELIAQQVADEDGAASAAT
ncbi:MAG: hypothetical protein CHACPFDD_00483 [Phycisphaerae bacterium]|nr:hypothetical protein [Phycisphaerae bacterium]